MLIIGGVGEVLVILLYLLIIELERWLINFKLRIR